MEFFMRFTRTAYLMLSLIGCAIVLGYLRYFGCITTIRGVDV
jgi:hypothetical protein